MSILPQKMDPTLWQQRLRVLTVVLVFVLIGPPVAVIAGALSITAILMGAGGPPNIIIWSLLFALGIFDVTAPFGYVTAAAAALAAGLAIGIRQAFYGPVVWWEAALVGIGLGVGVVITSGQLLLAIKPGGEAAATAVVLVIACLAATMACWGIVRGWYFGPQGRAEAIG